MIYTICFLSSNKVKINTIQMSRVTNSNPRKTVIISSRNIYENVIGRVKGMDKKRICFVTK